MADNDDRSGRAQDGQDTGESYRCIFENANSIILRMDTRGNILSINDFGCRFFGFDEGELIGKNLVGTIVPETDANGVDLARAMKDGLLLHPERFTMNQNENMRRDGSRVRVAWTNRPLLDGEGRPRGILSIGDDLNALKWSEARFRAVFDHAATGISLTGPDRRVILCNSALEKFLGYPKEELQSMHFTDFTYAGDIENDVQLYGELVTGKIDSYQYEKRYVKKNGHIVWGRLAVSSVKDAGGKFQFAVRILEDITDKKRMEDELRESASRLAIAQELAHFGSWSRDFRSGRIHWSDELYRIFGARPQEFPVDFDTFNEFIYPDDREMMQDSIAAALMDGTSLDVEYRIVGRDGLGRVVRSMAEVVYENGEPVQMYGTLQDITERKRVEGALLMAKNEAELYVDLMGHDINNMNQITMGFLELARDVMGHEGSLGMENVELLDKAYESLQNSSRLIDSVRKLQRGRAGFYRISPQDLGAILSDVVAYFSDVPGRDIRINYTPGDNHFVSANELLRDVFINLVGNSIKHSRGPLCINISADRLEQNGKRYCKVVIEDDGPGIPDGLKKSLFDRLNLATTRARGKGFGLCLTKMLVDDYGGRFRVEDRVPGDHTQGCRFVIVLPESN